MLIFDLDGMGADPADCTVFDDSAKACRTAKAAGMRVIAVFDERDAGKEPGLKSAADTYVTGFEELMPDETNKERKRIRTCDAPKTTSTT